MHIKNQRGLGIAEDLDGHLWNYDRDEVNNDVNENNGDNYKVRKTKIRQK